MRRLFASGWGRLFIVAWACWALWGAHETFTQYRVDGEDLFRFVAIGLAGPPFVLMVLRWIVRGFQATGATEAGTKDALVEWMGERSPQEIYTVAVVKSYLLGKGATDEKAGAAAFFACFAADEGGDSPHAKSARTLITEARLELGKSPSLILRSKDEFEKISATVASLAKRAKA